MADKKHRERLNYLVSKYASDFDNLWHKYQALCKRSGQPIKQFTSDASLYLKEEVMSVTKIQEYIQQAMNDIIKSDDSLREEHEAEKATKKRKVEKHRNLTCEKCGGKRIFSLRSKACDGNYWTLPSGKEGQGYAPHLRSICDGDGARLDICIECGHILGFDREAVEAEIDRLEEEEQY